MSKREDAMTQAEMDDFESYCRQCSDSQIRAVVADERERARRFGTAYYRTCYTIARAEARRRNLEA